MSPGSPAKPDAKYKIMDMSLEYKIVPQSDLARHITMKYESMAFPYDGVLRVRQIPVDKSDMTKSWSFNTPCRSFKGILVLFKVGQSYAWDTSRFYNPKVQKVSVIIEGKLNQLYAQGVQSFQQYNEICKYFAKG